MQQLLRSAGQVARVPREEGIALQLGLIAWYEQQYDQWVTAALEYYEGLPRCRGQARWGARSSCQDMLRFLHAPGVLFKNNQAERYP